MDIQPDHKDEPNEQHHHDEQGSGPEPESHHESPSQEPKSEEHESPTPQTAPDGFVNNTQQQVPVYPAEPSQPVFQTPLPQASAPAAKHQVDAGLVILQWLTYAFWGWTVLALSVLVGMVYASFIAKADSGAFTPYGIAAVLVLLPISFICDSFYSKREPQKKVGAEVLVMVIHAVIFALFGIGALIATVICLIMLFTSSSSDSSAIQVAVLSAITIAVFYGLTFMRTLNPASMPWIKRYYKMIMIITVGIFALLGIIGPVAKERSTRNDRLIESNLSYVEQAISDYARKNNKLPANLDDVTLNVDDAKIIVEKKLVVYKPEGSTTTTLKSTTRSSSMTFKYQLCATYTEKSGRSNYYDDYSVGIDDGYSTYVSTYNHDKGEVCYKLKTNSYSTNYSEGAAILQ